MSLIVRKSVLGVADTNRAVQPQKLARGLKFGMYEVEGLYYLCSGNKDADQLRDYRQADQRLCFPHMQKAGFLMTWLNFLSRQGRL